MNLQWKVIKRFKILIHEYQTQPANEESCMYERLTIDISIRVRRVIANLCDISIRVRRVIENLCFSSISSFN
jgi:hypothetical protein